MEPKGKKNLILLLFYVIIKKINNKEKYFKKKEVINTSLAVFGWIAWNFFPSLTTNLEYQMKSNYKTTSTTSRVNRETNLMRPLTARLEDGHCSITVVNHQLITIIRFISKSYIRLRKSFANRFHLVLHACEILV